MGRKPIDREQMRNRVLDAAEKSVATQGLGRASMSDLVRASGVSRRTFYKVFRSKEDVIRGMVDRKIEGTLDKAFGIVSGRATTAEKIEAMLGLVQRVTSFISPSLMREVATSHPRLWEYINEKRMKALELWRSILVDGQEHGEIRRDVDPDIFVLMLTTIAQNMITPTFLLEHDMTMPEMIEQLKLILVYGVLARDAREVSR
jgi:AcrR family transcriptional regulator